MVFLWAFALGHANWTCRAGGDISEAPPTYTVTGATLAQVALGFNQIDGNRVSAGQTVWQDTMVYEISYDVKVDASGSFTVTATPRKVKITVQFVVTLPIWNPNDLNNADAAARNEWFRFLAALEAHENGHVNILKNANYKAYTTRISNVAASRSSAKSLDDAKQDATVAINSQAAQIRKQMEMDLQTQSDAYDSKTNHGATQGAILNTSIR